MPTIRIQLDEATFKALARIAPSAKRQRTQFVRDVIRAAIRQQEYAQMRGAYRRIPDSATEADSWANCEKFD